MKESCRLIHTFYRSDEDLLDSKRWSPDIVCAFLHYEAISDESVTPDDTRLELQNQFKVYFLRSGT